MPQHSGACCLQLVVHSDAVRRESNFPERWSPWKHE